MAGRLLRPLENRLSAHALHRRNAQLLQLAARMDIVYLVKVPDADFHHKLWCLHGPRVVFDVNDALWHPFHRSYGYARFEEMVGWSDACFCENQFILKHVAPFARRSCLVPDCAQTEDFDHVTPLDPQRPRLRLGWVGSPQRAGTLYQVFEALEQLVGAGLDFELRILGASAENLPPFERVRFSCLPRYDREQMAREVKSMDIGLFPLYDVEDSYVRGNLKAKIYMAGGAVAACQSLGENKSLIRHRVNGVLMHDSDSWKDELAWLLLNPLERQAIAQAGAAAIRRTGSRAACFRLLCQKLQEIAATPVGAR